MGKASNGGGSGGQTVTLNAGALAAGSFICVSHESSEFANFFGTLPHTVGYTALNVNGDDAIELYLDGSVVDQYGDANTDATGQAWEYTDGWGYRLNGTLPSPTGWASGSANFYYSGANALDTGCDTLHAATCSNPFPAATYVPPSAPALPPALPPPLLSVPPSPPPAMPSLCTPQCTTQQSCMCTSHRRVLLFGAPLQRCECKEAGAGRRRTDNQPSTPKGQVSRAADVVTKSVKHRFPKMRQWHERKVRERRLRAHVTRSSLV
eukprot:4753112-Prymnesium_polylepis.2